MATQIPDALLHARDQLLGLPSGVKLVILHPDFHAQHRLLAPALEDSGGRALFVAVPEANFPLERLLARLEETLPEQLGGQAPSLPRSPEGAAGALAEALNGGKKPITLIVDGYDRLDQQEAAPFVAALTRALPEGARLILGTRTLPVPLLEREDLRDVTQLVPVSPERMMLDYVHRGGKTVLEVRALGPGRVLINGRLIEHWDGVLPRTLFFYFVDRGMTTRDEIFQTFWPTLSTREATNVFHVTKRKISEILGTDLTVYWSGFYRISPDLDLHYDAVKFVEGVQNAAVASDEEARRLLQTAIELYNGPFLSTMDQPWVRQRREELAGSYAEALAGLARLYRSAGADVDALGYYLRAAATSPQREDLARAIMELYEQVGEPQAALEAYERLKGELDQSLGVSPGPETETLAERIRGEL